MIFERGRGSTKRREWKRDEIEKVKEMKYLGYIIQKNEGVENLIKERKSDDCDETDIEHRRKTIQKKISEG